MTVYIFYIVGETHRETLSLAQSALGSMKKYRDSVIDADEAFETDLYSTREKFRLGLYDREDPERDLN